MLSITKIMHFEAGHALSNHKGECRNIHGHSYKLHVSVTGQPDAHGVLIDFKELKRLIHIAVLDELDHALILKNNDINTCATHNVVSKIFWMDAEPTAESMVCLIGDRIQKALPEHVYLARVKLYETESSYAEMEYPRVQISIL